jgi:dihydropteroate synthase
MRPAFTWKLRTRSLELGLRTLIMGIVNVTPDSFSDRGEFFHTDLALEHALRLLDEGANILDIGGESTRPGKREAVSALEESRRVVPVIKALLRERPEAVISVDTYKAETAERAIQAGAEIVNDVSGLRWDEAMPKTAARLGCGCVLMHTRGLPEEWSTLPPITGDELVPLVKRDLRDTANLAEVAGVRHESIVLDPGFGFGKRHDENYPLLARLNELAELGYPLLAGTSRKSFVAHTVANLYGKTEVSVADRIYGTLATNVVAILNGAHILRVHDVKPALEAAAIADAVLNAR